MRLSADYIREASLKKIEADYAKEREVKNTRVQQFKKKFQCKPNWWHASPAIETDFLIRNTQLNDENPALKTDVHQDYIQNRNIAQKLSQHQMNDNQM